MQSLTSSTRQLVPGGAPAHKRIVRASALSGDKLKRPELKRPEQPKKLFGDDAGASAPAEAAAPAAAAPAAAAPLAPGSSATIEWQRQRAKEMRKYFEDAKLAQLTTKSQVFGWTAKNEISNGRWVMFGWFVGMLTEYATGVDFPGQILQTVSYLGLWDFE
ncbi:hypothetical protein Rsub_12066 [Raphidocelis subcapitata]|uniref:Uncharacterized protein n=1 Tax=Raphidocelis subcapitata TaxID=307507 RepID=A0A2V0PKP6_9CHLO|nr:hypothetical protein Rsub_12066 [Raphidocelis subcapitata]|eukprot:GBF99602.1 hypothetical protein Rsub_12066 [Raphidocelis subcapitata]